jgi:tetratricopeptide (TPR) repeat protein
LLLRILRALVPEHDSRLDSIHILQGVDAENAAVNLIREIIGSRILIVLVENLDDLVRKLGGLEEMRFFDFLQHFSSCMVASSPGPTAHVLPPGSPFRRNFFQVYQLRELDLEDAINLISKIAEYQGDSELVSLIHTPRGRVRVRALRYLAGGNHRAYVIFAPLLTCESIDKLIMPLMQTIDDLTPYYNSRIAALPREQRQILEYICEERHPVQANDVAHASFLPRASASTQLDALCTMGYLHSINIGENSYYELREPLMRLSFEVKKHRGKPIGLLLDFLRLWYPPAELKQKLSLMPAKSAPEQAYIPDLEVLDKEWEDPRIKECCRDYAAAAQKCDYEHAGRAAEELVAIRGLKQDSIAQASCLAALGRFGLAIAVFDKLIDQNPQDALVWRLRASVLNRMGRYEEALSSCRKSLELDDNSVETWDYEASILLNLRRPEEALCSCETALKLNDKDPLAWATLGTALADMNLFDESSRAFTILTGLEPQSAKARIHLCAALIELKHWDEALEQAQHAIKLSPGEPEPWVLHGSVLTGMGRNQDSLTAFRKAESLGDNSAYVQFKMAELLLALGQWRDFINYLDRALGEFAHSENPNAGDTKTLIKYMLAGVSNPGILRASVKVLLLVYRKHGMLGAIAQGLIECIPDVLTSAKLSDAEASIWGDSWQQMAEPFPDFRLALRLLDATVRYRNTHDPAIFMSLPQEERTLLEAIAGLQVEAIA